MKRTSVPRTQHACLLKKKEVRLDLDCVSVTKGSYPRWTALVGKDLESLAQQTRNVPMYNSPVAMENASASTHSIKPFVRRVEGVSQWLGLPVTLVIPSQPASMRATSDVRKMPFVFPQRPGALPALHPHHFSTVAVRTGLWKQMRGCVQKHMGQSVKWMKNVTPFQNWDV